MREPEIVPIATTPVPEPELTVEVGDRLTTGHSEETLLYAVDDYTVQPVTPSLSALGGDHQTTVSTTFPPIGPTYFHTSTKLDQDAIGQLLSFTTIQRYSTVDSAQSDDKTFNYGKCSRRMLFLFFLPN